MIAELTPAEIERFYSKIHLGGCGLIWAGEVNNKGYGRFTIWRGRGSRQRERLLAHRLIYRLLTGDDPRGRVIRHGCDTPRCLTIDCLTPGTQADNVQDAIERDRFNSTGLLIPRHSRRAAARQRVAVDAKLCNRCKKVKSLGGFSRYSRSADGRQYECKTCLSERARRRLKQARERSAA